MAATTTLLGLVTPTQGTLSGTWGDTVNYGISDYVDISVAGTLTLTNDGAVTLANTTGSSSGNSITSSLTGAGTVTAQFAIVRVTGTLTVAKVVTGPSYSKTYTVVNAATGGIVTFKASGQTGVSVAVGETAFVYFNGTDYVKVVGTATAGAAGGSTTQVQYNNAGVLAGITGATTNGTALTLVAPNLGSPATVGTMPAFTLGGTVSGGGNQINNVIIGTTTPLAGAFTTLSATGAITSTLATTGAITATGSNNDAISAYIENSNQTGAGAADRRLVLSAAGNTSYSGVAIWQNRAVIEGTSPGGMAIGANTASAPVVFYAGARTEGMRLTSTGLGIGISSPAGKLSLRGAFSTTQTAGLTIESTGSTTGLLAPIAFYLQSSSWGTVHQATITAQQVDGANGGANLIFSTSSTGQFSPTEFLRIASTGAFGLSGANYGTSGQVLTSGGSGAAPTWAAAASGSQWTTSGSDIYYSTGNVGIKTTTFSSISGTVATLSLGGTNAATSGGVAYQINGTVKGYHYVDTVSSVTYLTHQSISGGQIFLATNTEKMRLDAIGNLGLGVTPKTWTLGSIMQIGATSAFWDFSGSAYVSSNRYYNGGNKRIASGYSTTYEQSSVDGSHIWTIAGTGAADSAITSTSAMTLTTNGVLLVGLTTPLASNGIVQVQTPSNQTNAIELKTNSGATGNAGSLGMFSDGLFISANYYYSSGQAKRVAANGTANIIVNAGTTDADTYISFATGTTGVTQPTEKARITSAGELLIGKTTATSGGGVLQISNGITFPATQSASTDANTLDDYEEGTFTPTLTGDGFTRTYNTQYTAANYVKVGRTVTINVVMLVSSQTGTYNSAVGLFNLPFTGKNAATSMRWGTFVCRMAGLPSNTPISKICTAQLQADNLNALGFYYYNAGTTYTDNLIDTTGWSGYQIGFTATYTADA